MGCPLKLDVEVPPPYEEVPQQFIDEASYTTKFIRPPQQYNHIREKK